MLVGERKEKFSLNMMGNQQMLFVKVGVRCMLYSAKYVKADDAQKPGKPLRVVLECRVCAGRGDYKLGLATMGSPKGREG